MMAQAAGILTETATLPFDTTKVRMQLQTTGSATSRYNGVFGTVKTIAIDEGPRALWNGLTPGI